jgi:hypothetical protein
MLACFLVWRVTSDPVSYGYLDMSPETIGSQFDFNVDGVTPDRSRHVDISQNGFYGVLKVDSETTPLIRLNISTLSGITANTSLLLRGATAIVAFSLTNSNPTPQTASVGCWTDIKLDDDTSAPVYAFSDRSGFEVRGSEFHFNFFLKNHAMVLNADTYWFGAYAMAHLNIFNQVDESSVSEVDTAAAFSWTRSVPPGVKIVVSAVLSWTDGADPPALNLSGTQIPSTVTETDELLFAGSVSGRSNATISIYFVADGDFTAVRLMLADVGPGANFSFSGSAQEWGIGVGSHTLDVYAIDSLGSICEAPISFDLNVWTSLPASRTSPGYATASSIVSASPASIASATGSETDSRSPDSVAPETSLVPEPPRQDSGGLSGGAIAALAVGAVLVVVAIVAVFLVCRRRVRLQKNELSTPLGAGSFAPF